MRTFLRAFTIQASWNYRTMIGNGFAFALLPVLRSIYDEEGLQRAAARHAEHFNAHPYLANLALGAVIRMEAEGAEPEEVARFKAAVRGPLGGIGDTLVWATLLPTCLLVSLVLVWLDAPAWVAVATFLVLYNACHLSLRVWAFRCGLGHGREIGPRLRELGLGRRAEALAGIGSVLIGVFVGVILLEEPGGVGGAWSWAWRVAALCALGAGVMGGHHVWRPTAAAVVVGIGLLLAGGTIL